MAKKTKSDLNSKIYIASGLRDIVKQVSKEYPEQNIFIICDKKLKIKIQAAFKYKNIKKIISVDVNESSKSFTQYQRLLLMLVSSRADRRTVLISIGGGVVGDLTGFVAATYMRGIEWVNIPTTLLAMVDSSYGGKVGVNFKNNKNLIGSFYAPTHVMIALDFIKTLSVRDIASGLAEMVKYALIVDRSKVAYFNKNMNSLLRKKSSYRGIIKWALQCKAQIVNEDPFEKSQKRYALNFGHTFGHALEGYTKFKVFRHGEAVGWGMRYALEASLEKKMLSQKNYNLYRKLLMQLTLPKIDKISCQKLWSHMMRDKKVENERIKFVFLNSKNFEINELTYDVHIKAFDKLRNGI